jgi:hypothetical protein
VLQIHEIRPPKGFPQPRFFGQLGSACFRLIMLGDERMACQPDTGKAKRIAATLHEAAAIPQVACGAVQLEMAH